MSKIVYLLGAGASFGKRASKPISKDDYEHGAIIEGLPIVNELPGRLEYIANLLQTYKFEEKTQDYSHFIYEFSQDLNDYLSMIIKDLRELKKCCQVHASIDTYAKKLWLTNDKPIFNKIKGLIGLYFIIEQIINDPDKRYDTFLASVLQKESGSLPDDIFILSWNYDSQIAIAYETYGLSNKFPVCDRMSVNNHDVAIDKCKIIQLNGSAKLAQLEDIFQNIDYSEPARNRLTNNILAALLHAYAQGVDNFKTHVTFAWEDYNQTEINAMLNSEISDAQVLVVIGYSFPFFNREIDRSIFALMPNLNKIYIQDINASEVEQSMIAAIQLPQLSALKNNIVLLSNVNQFYLPPEL